MRELLGLVFVVAVGAGCTVGDGPRRNCTELGWTCGLDDFGNRCGSCGADAVCSNGRCVRVGGSCGCGGRSCGLDDCGLDSCGSCSAGYECTVGVCVREIPVPTTRTIASGSVPLFDHNGWVRFTLPTGADVSFTTYSTDNDTYRVGIFTPTDWVTFTSGGTAHPYAFQASATSSRGSVPGLPAGTWYLGFDCTNLVQRCAVNYTVTATY